MLSTMQDGPLLISGILRHGQRVYGDSEVVTVEPGGDRRSTFTQVAGRAERLAAALRRLGVGDGDRVGTFAWNDQEHLEAYLAVPSMGAVLHTLNIRLFPEQLAYVVNHGEDKVVIVDASVAPLLARVRDRCPSIEHVIVVGEGDTDGLGADAALRGADRGRGDRLRLARPRRTPGGGHVLHERDDRQSQGCRLQPPVDLAALLRRDVGQPAWAPANATGSS